MLTYLQRSEFNRAVGDSINSVHKMCTNEEYKLGEYSSTIETQHVLKLNILLVLKGSRGFMIRVEDLGVKSSITGDPNKSNARNPK